MKWVSRNRVARRITCMDASLSSIISRVRKQRGWCEEVVQGNERKQRQEGPAKGLESEKLAILLCLFHLLPFPFPSLRFSSSPPPTHPQHRISSCSSSSSLPCAHCISKAKHEANKREAGCVAASIVTACHPGLVTVLLLSSATCHTYCGRQPQSHLKVDCNQPWLQDILAIPMMGHTSHPILPPTTPMAALPPATTASSSTSSHTHLSTSQQPRAILSTRLPPMLRGTSRWSAVVEVDM